MKEEEETKHEDKGFWVASPRYAGYENIIFQDACWNSYPPQYGCECGKYSSDADGEFIAFSRNHMRQLLDLAFAAKKFHDNFNKYWTGYPSKMDWPELHVLRQKLEVLDEGK